MVGTFRDVTAEHYAVQRQTALAALNQLLAQADTARRRAARPRPRSCAGVWRARRVLAVTFPRPSAASRRPTRDVVSVGEPTQWADAAGAQRVRPSARCATASCSPPTRRNPASAGIALQHPHGVLVVWIELAEQRPFTAEDHTLLTVLAGRLGQGLQRVHQLDQQRETALALQHAILGPASLPGGFRGAISAGRPPASGRRRLVRRGRPATTAGSR